MADCLEAIAPLTGAPQPVLDAVLELNQHHVSELSALEPMQLATLITRAFHAVVVGDGAAFLLAFDQGAAYDSLNFRWFQSRYPRFVYVDRVAVAAAARGKGLASRLYADLYRAAEIAGHSVIACEVNFDPPNPVSDAFHKAQGFEEAGQSRLPNGKMVRYLVKRLANG